MAVRTKADAAGDIECRVDTKPNIIFNRNGIDEVIDLGGRGSRKIISFAWLQTCLLYTSPSPRD